MLVWLYAHGFPPFVVAMALCAWRWGQWPERAAATSFVAALLATKLAKLAVYTRFFYVEIGVLAVDGALLVALGWLAIKSGRGWLIWATAFQLLSTSAHLARAMDSSISALAYQIMAGASCYPALTALGVGIWRNPRQRRAKPAARF